MASTDTQRTGAWIFLSHSNRDWAEVRKIRNLLEERGHKPIMFFLKCLTDDSELDELLRREIEARTWFLLCDSVNAQASRYVRAEVSHIKSLEGKYSETISLDDEVEAQVDRIDRLCRRATVYISYHRDDQDVALRIREFLANRDYDVYWPETDSSGSVELASMSRAIADAAKRGFVLVVISPRSAKSKWVAREIEVAMTAARDAAKNIIVLSLDRASGTLRDLAPILAYHLAVQQWIELSEESLEEGLEVLAASMLSRSMG